MLQSYLVLFLVSTLSLVFYPHHVFLVSTHPWEYPDINNSPDGTYALGFHPESYAAGIYVSADNKPVSVELNDCPSAF